MEKNQIRLLKQVLNEPEKHQKALKTFEETYEGLQIGNYSMNNVIGDIIENDIANIEQSFKKIASDQLDKSGVTSPLLKANLLKGCNEVLAQFQASIDGLIQSVEAYNKKLVSHRIKATQMKIAFMGIQGYSIRFANQQIKHIEIGIGAGFVTQCNKSFDFKWNGRIDLHPGNETYYLYAKVAKGSKEGILVMFKEPQPNTDDHSYILWQSGSFDEIKI